MLYLFRAKNFSGEEISGEHEAHDRLDLARWLKKQGYVLTSLEQKKKRFLSFNFSLPFFSGVSLADKMIFSRNLSVMLKAGLSVLRALLALSSQTSSRKFREVLADVSSRIRKGQSLADALESHPKVFSSLFASMVRAGEKSGKMGESLDIIATQLQRDLELKRTVKNALMYPLIIVITMVLIGILMLIIVVPTLVQTFEELGVALPLSTRIIIFISGSFRNLGIFLIVVFLGVLGLLFWLFRTGSGKKFLDELFLKTPLIKSLVRKVNSARTCRTLSSLISSGVDIVEALEVTKMVLGNHKYQEVLERAKAAIEKGSPISSVFKERGNLYPPLVGEMVQVGEETGALSEMLFRLAVFFEEEVAAATKNLTVIIEPVLMIVIGLVVGFFAVSMIQPMYSMLEGL